MGIVVRQSLKSAVVTLLGLFMGVAVTFLSMRYFTQTEYGFTNNLIKIATQVSFLGLFGFNYALLVQGQKYRKDDPARAAFLAFCALFPLVLTILVTLGFILFQDFFISLYKEKDQPMMHRFFYAFPIFIVVNVLTTWLSSYLQSIQKNALQALGVEVIYRAVYIALICFYALDLITFGQFIYGFSLAFLPSVFMFLRIAKKHGHFHFNLHFKLPKAELREIVRFSAYHSLILITTVLIFQVDGIMVGTSLAKDGLMAAGIYNVAYIALSFLRNPTRVIATTAVPTFAQHYNDHNLKGLRDLYHRSCINMQLFALVALALIWLNRGAITEILNFIQNGYEAVTGLILILMLGQVADMICGFNYQIISISKYYRFNFWISLVLLVLVVVLNAILIPIYDIEGAAWATSIGMIIFNLVKMGFVTRKFKMLPFTKTTLVVALIVLMPVLVTWLLPVIGGLWMDFVIKNLIFLGLVVGLMLKFKPSPEIDGMIQNVLKRKRLF